MIFCRLFLLFLVGVDWVDDPHFGNSMFSRPMASQPFQVISDCDHQELNVAGHMAVLCRPLPAVTMSVFPAIASLTPMSFFPFCIPSMHFFMSLQQ
jgi:hypothetical protein